MVKRMPGVAPFHHVKSIFRTLNTSLAGIAEEDCGRTIGGVAGGRPAGGLRQHVGDDEGRDRNIYCPPQNPRPTLPVRESGMGDERPRTGIEGRIVELGDRLVETEAPAHWTNAQVEAWIDWA